MKRTSIAIGVVLLGAGLVALPGCGTDAPEPTRAHTARLSGGDTDEEDWGASDLEELEGGDDGFSNEGQPNAEDDEASVNGGPDCSITAAGCPRQCYIDNSGQSCNHVQMQRDGSCIVGPVFCFLGGGSAATAGCLVLAGYACRAALEQERETGCRLRRCPR